MSSLDPIKLLSKLFLTTAHYEHEIESLRIHLAEQEEFEPYAIFQRISRLARGYISSEELSDYLSFNGFEVSEKDISYLIRLYDNNDDKKLSYRNFLNFVLPNSSPELRQICTQRESYVVNDNELLPSIIEKNLAELINFEIDLFNDCDSIKNDLVNSKKFELKAAFGYLSDENDRTIINMDSLFTFHQNQNIDITEEDAFCMIKRMDKDLNGFICYSEFVEFILPIKPYARISTLKNNDLSIIDQTHFSIKIKDSPFSKQNPNKSISIIDHTEKLEKSLLSNRASTHYITPARKHESQEKTTFPEKSLQARAIPEKERNFEKKERDLQTQGKAKNCYPEPNHSIDKKQFSPGNKENPEIDLLKETDNFDKKRIDLLNIEQCETYPPKEKHSIKKNECQPRSIEKSELLATQEKSNPKKIETQETNNPGRRKNSKLNDLSLNLTKNSNFIDKDENDEMIVLEEMKNQLSDLMFTDSKINHMLQNLYDVSQFDLDFILNVFEEPRKKIFTAKDLEGVLRKAEIFISKFEVYCFIEKYDRNQKGFLTGVEFVECFAKRMKNLFQIENSKNVKKPQKNFETKLIRILAIIINFECDCLMLQRLSTKHAKFSFLDLYVMYFKQDVVLKEYLHFLKANSFQNIKHEKDIEESKS